MAEFKNENDRKTARMIKALPVKDHASGYMLHKDGSIASSILEQMNRLREAGDYCDVTLVVGECPQVEIHAHRVVLFCYSSYFEGLLSPNMKEGRQKRIELHNLDADSVYKLVEFAYTGCIEITSRTVENLLKCANFIFVESVIEACSSYMKDHMTPENCIGVLRCAEHYNLDALKKAATSMILTKFPEVVAGDEFSAVPSQMPLQVLGKSIEDESLIISASDKVLTPAAQEKVVLEAVIKYLTLNKLEKAPEAIELFRSIRIPLVDKDAFEELMKSDLVDENQELKEFLKQRRGVEKREVLDPSAEPWSRPRLCPGLIQMNNMRCFGEMQHFQKPIAYLNEIEDLAAYVSAMRVWIRSWDGRLVVGALEVTYSSGEMFLHGRPRPTPQDPYEENSYEENSFELPSNQRIVDIQLRAGWLIDSIGFTSSDGHEYGPFGGTGGNLKLVKKPNNKNRFLSCIHSWSAESQGGTVICRLEFEWSYYEYDVVPRRRASLLTSWN